VSDSELMPDLTAYDRRWVQSAKRVPATRGIARPFDHAALVQYWREAAAGPAWRPASFPIPVSMSRAEAVFWLLAASCRSEDEMRALGLDRSLSFEDVVDEVVRINHRRGESAAADTGRVLAHLLDARALLEMIEDEAGDAFVSAAMRRAEAEDEALSTRFPAFRDADADTRQVLRWQLPAALPELRIEPPRGTLLRALLAVDEHPAGGLARRIIAAQHRRADLQYALATGFCNDVAPYLEADEFAAGAARIRCALGRYEPVSAPAHLYHLAAAFHLSDLVEPFVAAIAQERFGHRDRQHFVYALGSRERIAAEMARLGLRPYGAQDVREWFALMGRQGIPAAFAAPATLTDVADLVDALGSVRVVETATAILALTVIRDFEQDAKAWLDRYPELAVPAAAAAAEKRTRRDAAIDTLKRASANGHAALVETYASPAVRAIVFGVPAAGDELSWLDEAGPARGKPIRWLYADALPPLVIDGPALDERQVDAAIGALRAGTLIAPDPRVAALRRRASAAHADRFVLALARQWLRAGASAPDKWTLYAVGLLGGDESATALAAYIRQWPGESQHARAVIGLDCLRAIGSDVALMQIAGLAQKLPFAALKKRAGERLEEIARERGLTRDRLEDRVVPTLDLVDGERPLTLRGAAYVVGVNDALKPLLRDASGKTLRDLPKRADGESDEDVAARAEWKLFKKQLRDVASVQVGRLEAAMVSQRSWFTDEFVTLLVAHPIVGRLARRLVWTADSAGERSAVTFRIRGDGDLVDVHDAVVTLPSAGTVRVVHRLELAERDLDAWEARLAAAAIEQPFRQLDRVTYRLDDIERATDAIRRFDATPIAEPVMLARLRARSWERGTPGDGGGYTHHAKRFEKAGLTAVLQHDLVIIGFVQPDARIAIAGCMFLRGRDIPDPTFGQPIPLRDVPEVPISEVCADCAFVLG